MPTQKDMIREAMQAIAQRRSGRTKLVYDKVQKTIVAVSATDQPPKGLNISSEDADMFCSSVVTITSDYLDAHWSNLVSTGILPTQLSEWDEGDAYSLCEIGPLPGYKRILGAVVLEDIDVTDFPVVIRLRKNHDEGTVYRCPNGTEYRITAERTNREERTHLEVRVENIATSIAARRRGLLETDLLRDKSILDHRLGNRRNDGRIGIGKSGSEYICAGRPLIDWRSAMCLDIVPVYRLWAGERLLQQRI